MSSIWRPFTQMQTADKTLPFVSKGRKALLTLKNGKQIIDAISSWWVITHGHCEPAITKAVQNQANLLDQVLFANFTHEPAQNLVKEISSLLPRQLNRVFFSDNGSTAVEVALKIAVQSWKQRGQAQKTHFLTFRSSYHGDTTGAMSVSGPGIFTSPYKPLLFPVITAKQGRFSSDPPETYYKDFEEKLNQYSDKLAAVIIEPFIQGAGGMIVWPKAALEHIGRLAKQSGLYIIFDEIMTGFGRTGSLFALNQLGFHPDILCLSKGLTGGMLPLALTISTKKIYESFLSTKKERAFFHGHSFTGNPISCAAAVANLQLLRKNRLAIEKKWKRIAHINKERGESLRSKPFVKDVRLKGLIAAVENHSAKGYTSSLAEVWSKSALRRGVFLRPLGDTIYILPPYSITEEQLHKVWDVIEALLLEKSP